MNELWQQMRDIQRNFLSWKNIFQLARVLANSAFEDSLPRNFSKSRKHENKSGQYSFV